MVSEEENTLSLATNIIRLRQSQLLVNERLKSGDFVIPIHLAIGHEAIAVAVSETMVNEDKLFLTHRNIHYNLARSKSLRSELDEYYLRDSGVCSGAMGSMNLAITEEGVAYTSSILGNNMPVAVGYSLGNKNRGSKSVVFVVTGDGAIEEGTFYESLVFARTNELSTVFLVENNEWSLGTRIEERRSDINLEHMAKAVDAHYLSLKGNHVSHYLSELQSVRKRSLETKMPIIVEVELTTLGYWFLDQSGGDDGKFINYHAGPAPTTMIQDLPWLVESDADPVYVLRSILDDADLLKLWSDQHEVLQEELL